MRIGELARRTGASTRSLRHYESSRLIYSTRLPNGYREFDDSQVNAVMRIRALLDAGLDLDAIAKVVPCYDGQGIPRQCVTARARIAAELARLHERAGRIAVATARLRALLDEPGIAR